MWMALLALFHKSVMQQILTAPSPSLSLRDLDYRLLRVWEWVGLPLGESPREGAVLCTHIRLDSDEGEN